MYRKISDSIADDIFMSCINSLAVSCHSFLHDILPLFLISGYFLERQSCVFLCFNHVVLNWFDNYN